MCIRIKNKKITINREAYKNLKRCDHEQMREALQKVYEEGLKDAEPKESRGETLAIAKKALLRTLEGTKGIGEKRREEIVQKFRELLEEPGGEDA